MSTINCKCGAVTNTAVCDHIDNRDEPHRADRCWLAWKDGHWVKGCAYQDAGPYNLPYVNKLLIEGPAFVTGFQFTDEDRANFKKLRTQLAQAHNKPRREIFYDLCFAICSPQTTAVGNGKVMRTLATLNFHDPAVAISLARMRQIVRPVRFLRKADYLLKAKEQFPRIVDMIANRDPTRTCCVTWQAKREYLVQNVLGLGMKTASMFLKCMGDTDLAVIDTHILKFLKKPPPKSKREYLSLEILFQAEAARHRLTTAEFDAYIWVICSDTPWRNYNY